MINKATSEKKKNESSDADALMESLNNCAQMALHSELSRISENLFATLLTVSVYAYQSQTKKIPHLQITSEYSESTTDNFHSKNVLCCSSATLILLLSYSHFTAQ